MEQYWRGFTNYSGNLAPMDMYWIEREDHFISISGGGISTYSGLILSEIFDPKYTVLQKVPKLTVTQALKEVLKSLDLPVEINQLKHKL